MAAHAHSSVVISQLIDVPTVLLTGHNHGPEQNRRRGGVWRCDSSAFSFEFGSKIRPVASID